MEYMTPCPTCEHTDCSFSQHRLVVLNVNDVVKQIIVDNFPNYSTGCSHYDFGLPPLCGPKAYWHLLVAP